MSLDVEKFLFDTPLYTPIVLDESEEIEDLKKFNSTKGLKLRGYNPIENEDSIFKITSNFYMNEHFYSLKDSGLRIVTIRCKQHDNEFHFYVDYQKFTRTLTKIGQQPSVADFHKHELKKYSKVLSDESLREFSRAIGLAANGIGIGSYVYLRRIFETLIKEASEKLISEGDITENDFIVKRMEDKIESLKGYLPAFLLENKQIYSILSLGIHELDEKTCLAYFDSIRIGIEIILDEQLETIKRNKKTEDAKKKISNIYSQIKSNR